MRPGRKGCAHDPSILEWEGTYYAYSTDTFGAPNGYQIRTSTDLLHWEYAGSAFEMEGTNRPLQARQGRSAARLRLVRDLAERSRLRHLHPPRRHHVLLGARRHARTRRQILAVLLPDGLLRRFQVVHRSCQVGFPDGQVQVRFGSFSARPQAGAPPTASTRRSSKRRAASATSSTVLTASGCTSSNSTPATGRRKDGRAYTDWIKKRCTFEEFYGTHIASGSVEGGVIRYHEGVDVLEDGKWTKKNYYYLMCSYGSLSSDYCMRCGRSETPEGPYLDVNGNPLVCSDRPRHGQ